MSRTSSDNASGKSPRRGRRPRQDLPAGALGTRIRERREKLGRTQTEVAREIGFKSHVGLLKIETGDTKEIPETTLIRLAQVLRSDFGEPRLRKYVPKDESPATAASQIRLVELLGAVDIPIVGRVPAGPRVEPIEYVETITLPPSLAHRNKRVYGLLVQGDSMKDEGIWPGDVVFVAECPDPMNGQIVVASVNGEVTLKKWNRKGRRVTLTPANPAYSKIEITAGVNEVRCAGEYIGLLRMKRR